MKRYWMRSLTGQWIALALLALAISQVLFFFIYRAEQARTVLELRRDEFLARFASVTRLVTTVDPSLHPEILRAASTSVVRFWLNDKGPGDLADWQKIARTQLLEAPRAPLSSDLPALTKGKWGPIRPENWTTEPDANMLTIEAWNGFGLATQIRDGLWVHGVYAKPRSITGPPWYYYLSVAVSVLLLSIITVVIGRRISRPLNRLTESAESLGRGEELSPVPEEGADDIRRTASAFNRMQSRLRLFIEDRTRMIAAISHDLRTPITSLRLRAEFIDDEEMKQKVISTLDEMKEMTEATLAFGREDATTEITRSVDLNALVQSLCDDLSDLAWDVKYESGDRLPWRCRPNALKRALRNVIENAVRYGRCAHVSLRKSPANDGVEIIVEDEGHGIPEQDHDKVFDAFVRLESSRNRGTGGVGLGLSIARTLMRSHGGDIRLSNRENTSGLRVTLWMPE